MKISKFLDKEMANYASYSTLRAIASYIDGLKNAHRKVLRYVLDHNFNSEKVLNLAGKCSVYSEYLHGDISGSIITLAQDFRGANQIPLLKRKGNFGNNLDHTPSATRYIYTAAEDYLKYIFKEDDEPLLIKQKFEGVEIEPRYYVPIIPLLVINGSEGIATGFSQRILPRKYEDVIDYIKAKLNNQPLPKLNIFIKDFKGDVIIEGKKIIVRGKLYKKARRIHITELPLGYELNSYLKELYKLEEKGIVKDIEDRSDDSFYIIVRVDPRTYEKDEEELIKILKLEKFFSENYTCIDENNRVRVFNNIEEILDAYINIRLQYYTKRKKYLLQKLKEELEFLLDKVKFIKAVVNNELIINKRNENEIFNDAKNIGIKFIEKHINMKISSLTKEKIVELNNKIKSLKDKINELENKTEKDLWLEELEELNKFFS